MKTKLHHGVIKGRTTAGRYVEGVSATKTKSVPKLALVSARALPMVERKTGSHSVPSAWKEDLFISATTSGVDAKTYDALLRRQMGAKAPEELGSGYCLQTLRDKSPKETVNKIAALEKEVSGHGKVSLRRIRASIRNDIMIVATKNNSLASFLFVAKQQDILVKGVTAYDINEPMTAQSHPKELGNELIRHAKDSIACFAPNTNLVVVMDRADDPENNAAMMRMGFVPSKPFMRGDTVRFLWVHNTSADLKSRKDLSEDKNGTSADKVKALFKKKDFSVSDIIRKCRVPGYDALRLRALKAVAEMERGKVGKPEKETKQEPKKEPQKDEKKVPKIESKYTMPSPASAAVPQPASVTGVKRMLSTLDEVRTAVRAKGYRSLDSLLQDYDIHPSLDDMKRKHWRTVAIIAANTRMNK